MIRNGSTLWRHIAVLRHSRHRYLLWAVGAKKDFIQSEIGSLAVPLAATAKLMISGGNR